VDTTSDPIELLMSAPAQFTGLSGVRHRIPNLCLGELSAADQQLVDDALAWMQFLDDEHRVKAARRGDSVCSKCGVGRMQFYQPKSRFECPECGFVEPAPKT